MITSNRESYLKSIRRRKAAVLWTRILLISIAGFSWEMLARGGVIDSFITSSPSRIAKTILSLARSNLLTHLSATLAETLLGFAIGVLLGVSIAALLWRCGFLRQVLEPFLVVINAIPKVALGPIIIIWAGAGQAAIVIMGVAISLVVTILSMLSAFCEVSPSLITMAKTLGATPRQIFSTIVFPNSLTALFSGIKINIGLSLVGVITGEFLVSKAGLGYLIVYGGQVFRLDLVMASVTILTALAAALYFAVALLEKLLIRHKPI